MSVVTDTAKRSSTGKSNLVEMNWDPITRIVGSLGIFTKIDFGARKVPSATAPPRSSAATASS